MAPVCVAILTARLVSCRAPRDWFYPWSKVLHGFIGFSMCGVIMVFGMIVVYVILKTQGMESSMGRVVHFHSLHKYDSYIINELGF